MKNNKAGNGGYFTVEAVLILPIALAIILLVMQIWFFRYNRVLQETDTCGVLVRSSHMQDLDAEERAEYVTAELQKRYKDKYIAWNFGEINTSVSKGVLTCNVSAGSGLSPGSFAPWSGGPGSEAVTERSTGTVSEVFIIRSYRKLLGIDEKIKDLSEG